MSLSKTSAVLLYVSIFGFFIYYVSFSEMIRLTAVAAGLILLVLELRGKLKRYWPLFFLGGALLLGLWIEAARTGGQFGITSSVLVMAQIGVALALLKGRASPRLANALFLLSAGYIVYHMFSGVSPDAVLTERSRNHVSVFIIYAACLNYAVNTYQGRKINMIPAITALVISVWALGRGGILSSAFLLAGIFFVVKKTRLDYLFIALGCLLLFFGLFGGELLQLSLFEKSFSLAKFDRGVVDVARSEIIERYMEMLDINRLLIGFDPDEIYYLFPTGNLHNSYLTFHFRVGIFALVVMIMALIALVRGLLYNRVYFILLTTIMLRAVSDTILLPAQNFDFVFCFLVTVSILSTKNSIRKPVATLAHRPISARSILVTPTTFVR